MRLTDYWNFVWFQSGHGISGGYVPDIFSTDRNTALIFLQARSQIISVMFNVHINNLQDFGLKGTFLLESDDCTLHGHGFGDTGLVEFHFSDEINFCLLLDTKLGQLAVCFHLLAL